MPSFCAEEQCWQADSLATSLHKRACHLNQTLAYSHFFYLCYFLSKWSANWWETGLVGAHWHGHFFFLNDIIIAFAPSPPQIDKGIDLFLGETAFPNDHSWKFSCTSLMFYRCWSARLERVEWRRGCNRGSFDSTFCLSRAGKLTSIAMCCLWVFWIRCWKSNILPSPFKIRWNFDIPFFPQALPCLLCSDPCTNQLPAHLAPI